MQGKKYPATKGYYKRGFSVPPRTTSPVFIHFVSSPHRHPPTPHLSTNTCAVGVERDLSSAAGLSVWGRGGYHVHLNKGPVFRQTCSRTLCSLITPPAPRLPEQDTLSRTTCRPESGCTCRHIAQMNKIRHECECSLTVTLRVGLFIHLIYVLVFVGIQLKKTQHKSSYKIHKSRLSV